MVEYIVKEQALEAILSAIDLTGEQWAQVWNKIKQTPAANVVEVVRCKDCMYFTPQAGWGGGQCSYLEDKFEFSEVLMFDDDYCSDGERKDGGESDD